MARLVERMGITRYEADEYYRKALDFYQKHNLEEAILHINQAIELFPNRAEYFAARGLFRLEDGLPTEASADFDHSLKIHPYELLANYGKGAIAYKNNEFEIAREYFRKAWAVNPERTETIYYLGLVEYRLNNPEQAIIWMRQASSKFDALGEDKEAKKHKRDADRWIIEMDRIIQREKLV